jgi:hypothetical protein
MWPLAAPAELEQLAEKTLAPEQFRWATWALWVVMILEPAVAESFHRPLNL